QEPDAAPTREQAAQRAAEIWLALIGEAKYAESWQAAGSQIKQAVTSEQWTQQGANVAAQLGAFQRRELQDAQHTTELPNAPAGEYMVLTYSSAFATCRTRGRWRSSSSRRGSGRSSATSSSRRRD